MRAVARNVGWSSTMRTVVVTGLSSATGQSFLIRLAAPAGAAFHPGRQPCVRGAGIVGAEDGGAGDKERRAGLRARPRRRLVDAAVDLDVDALSDQGAQ